MTKHNTDSAVAVTPRAWMLVIDDNDPFRQIFLNNYDTPELEVVGAENAVAALKILAESPTDPLLVLIDVLMPGMDGLTLARKIKAKLKGRGKIVIMSGHQNDISWWPVDLRDLSYLSKPFPLTVVDALLYEARGQLSGQR